MIENEEFIKDFIEEARTHIETLELELVKPNPEEMNKEEINNIFRAVHSIKGTASFFNLTKIVELAHSMENIMGEIREDKFKLTSDIIDLLLASNDCLKSMVEDVVNSENYDIEKFVEKFKALKDNPEAGVIKEQTGVIKEETDSNEEINDTEIKKNKPSFGEDNIRVNVSLLNILLNLASEMVLGRNQLIRAMEKHRKNIVGMDSILQNIDHITTELQEKVMQTRMQTVANVFNKFPRIIRDMAKKLNKEIELTMEGEEVELDKSIIESLGDPLTHLIRNAVDHGLETVEERKQLGKNSTGKVTLKAYHESGYVNIDIIDDGRGIGVEKIKKKAIQNGIVTCSEIEQMNEHEIVQLVFSPGFSTVDVVTDFSGRGVGMDVVKTNIEKLGGAIEIFTAPEKGTTFRLLLPLTLAIIPSIIVEVEGQKFALPQVNLSEIVRIKPGDHNKKIEHINNSEVLRRRGGLLPIIHLADVLGIKREDSESLMKTDSTKTIRILVIKMGSKRIGIAVDKIHGSEEILVKPLPSFIKDCKCYSGVTIMGDGKTAMILDPDGIIVKANLHFNDTVNQKPPKENFEELSDLLTEYQSILLFKCSGTETMAIDLSMVSRVEEIKQEEIELVGNMEYIKFRGDMLRVIRPENHLQITKGSEIYKKYYVIIPKLVKNPVGILIEKILDTVHIKIKLNNEDISTKGIVGSTIINNEIVLLLNIYELFEMVDPKKYAPEKLSLTEKLTILVVEDTPFFQKLEKDYLEDAGHKVYTANNGKEALDFLAKNEVDMIISDIKMPVLDGLGLIKKIRADKSLCHLPAIAVTSMTDESHINEGLEAGFDIYEFKLDRTRLISVIQEAIDHRRSLT